MTPKRRVDPRSKSASDVSDDADGRDEDLAERVRRLEAAVATLQAQLAAQPMFPAQSTRATLPTDPEDQPVAALAIPEPVAALAMPEPVAALPSSESASPMRAVPPAPVPEAGGGLEAAIGTYWLSRLGIVALVTGIAWFIAIHFGEMSPAMRVAAGYGLSGAIAGFGAWLARSHRLLGHVVLGGGLAVAYFVTYALHFIAPLRMIDDGLLALVLLTVVVAAIVAIGQHLRSETVAGVALFLGFHSGMVGEIRAFTLLSTTLLAAAAAYLFVRNRWVLVPLSSMVAVYLTHGIATVTHHEAVPTRADVVLALAFLLVCFVVFATAALARADGPGKVPRDSGAASHLPVAIGPRFAQGASVALDPAHALALGNLVFFVAFGTIASFAYERALLLPFLATATVLVVVAAAVAHRRGARSMVEIHLAAAIPTLAWAIGEAIPATAAVVLSAILGALAVQLGVRSRMTAVAAVGTVTLGVVLLGAGLPPRSFVALAAVGAAFIASAHGARSLARGVMASALRIGSACGAAIAFMLSASALVDWSYVTLAWVMVALGLVGLGLFARERPLRLVGLGVLALSACKLLIVDLALLPTDQRILTFIASGAILLGLSFAYTRFKGSAQRLL